MEQGDGTETAVGHQDGHGRGMDPGTRWFPTAMRPNSHASMVAYPSRSPSLSPEVGAGDGPR